MAEKGTIVTDAASGESIATRDAFEQDDGGNARVIQRFDMASGRGPSPRGDATRGSSAAISTADGTDLTNLPADLTSNLIDVGDKSMLVVHVEQAASDGTCEITPIMYDGEATPGVVGTQLKQMAAATALRRGASSGNYISNVLTWDLAGSHKVGIHISSIGGTSNAVSAWAYVI